MIFQDKKYNSILLLIFFLVCFISVNSESLWLDEILTLQIYYPQKLSEMLNMLIEVKGSEVQMPGWMIFMWSWRRIVGVS